MIFVSNQDSSYFKVTSSALPLDTVLTKDIISFNVVEEAYKMTAGNISIYDPNLQYSYLLRQGAPLTIEWGYQNPDMAAKNIIETTKNPAEMKGSLSRLMKGIIMSPGGSGDQKGVSVYNCSFYGSEYASQTGFQPMVYQAGTKAVLVAALLLKIGCATMDVLFQRGTEAISPKDQIIQDVPDFKFLARLANQWRCLFRVGHTKTGTLHGIFVDFDKYGFSLIKQMTSGAIGNSISLAWKWGKANVINYKWQCHVGDSASGGDNVRIIFLPNGQPTFIRYIAQGETVKAYIFHPERVEADLLRKQAQGGISAMADYMKWAMSVQDFNQIVKYFEPYTETTAPQGFGYTLDVEMFGNPMMTVPMPVIMTDGFPANFQNMTTGFYSRKVEHRIDKSGYKMSVEVVDTLTLTGGSYVG